MTKTLRIPNEYRFVRAFALRSTASLAVTVDLGDTLGLLMEIGALPALAATAGRPGGSPDPSASLRTGVGIVRRTREALTQAYDRASDLKDWDQTHAISVLREALAQSDSAAYLRSTAAVPVAYQVRNNHRAAHTATEYAEALRSTASLAVAIVGCAADTLTLRRRPWEIEPDDLSLPEWRKRVWKLLREAAMPGNALPRPSASQAPADLGCPCSELDSPKALAGEHTPWCPSGMNPKEG